MTYRARVINVYSLPWQYDGESTRNPTEELQLGNLREHYELFLLYQPIVELPHGRFAGV